MAGAGFFLSLAAQRVSRKLRLVALESVLKQDVGFFDRTENAAGGLTAAMSTSASNASNVVGLIAQNLITSSAE
jgi:ATP-binding cassette, subfamily B (MDR/TAP), member 1